MLSPRANGGPVKAGGNFSRRKRARIIRTKKIRHNNSNDKLGGGSTNISVNVDASGSSVQGNEQQEKNLAELFQQMIQSELLNKEDQEVY